MDSEAKRAKEMVKQLSFKKKLAHFWYYYKKYVMWGLFALALISWGVYEKATMINYDLNIPYFSSRAIDLDNNLERFKEYFIGAVKDSNNNGRVDVAIVPYTGDIEKAKKDEVVGAVLTKLDMSLAADDAAMYIFDERYLEHFKRAHEDIKFTEVEISQIPEVREALGLIDQEKAYLITLELFDRLKDNDKKIAEHNNAKGLEKFFEEKIK